MAVVFVLMDHSDPNRPRYKVIDAVDMVSLDIKLHEIMDAANENCEKAGYNIMLMEDAMSEITGMEISSETFCPMYVGTNPERILGASILMYETSIERKEGKIRFPWFTNHGIDGEAKAYMQLVSGIAKRAKMLTRVTATESVSDNEKFTMRLFLVSLNFKGEEYKFARKFLLRNLSGNSSWRTEDAKARHDARKVQQEIEAPEVTIEHLSEGGEDDAELSE